MKFLISIGSSVVWLDKIFLLLVGYWFSLNTGSKLEVMEDLDSRVRSQSSNGICTDLAVRSEALVAYTSGTLLGIFLK